MAWKANKHLFYSNSIFAFYCSVNLLIDYYDKNVSLNSLIHFLILCSNYISQSFYFLFWHFNCFINYCFLNASSSLFFILHYLILFYILWIFVLRNYIYGKNTIYLRILKYSLTNDQIFKNAKITPEKSKTILVNF